MAVYVRGAGGHTAERVQAEPGSPEEMRLEQLADDPASGWRRVSPMPEDPPETPEDLEDLPTRPAQSAVKAVWVEWAVAGGMDQGQAEDLTKDQLIELADQLEEE